MFRPLRASLCFSLTLTLPASALAETSSLAGMLSMSAQRQASSATLEPAPIDADVNSVDEWEDADRSDQDIGTEEEFESEDYADDGAGTEESAAPARERKPYPVLESIDIDSMSEHDVIEQARKYYAEAEVFVADGEWEEAIVRYEAAYRLVPAKHGFAYKVGVSAYEIKDCELAKEYLDHLVTYGTDQIKLLDKVQHAKHILSEIKLNGCSGPSAPAEEPTLVGQNQAIEASPLDQSIGSDTSFMRSKKFDPAQAKGRRKRAGGGILLTTGLLGIAGGTTTLVLALTTRKKLQSLTGTTDRFPTGDYACREALDECPYELELQLKLYNILTPISLAVGGTALTLGAILLAVGKKSKPNDDSPSAMISPIWMRGGGGAAATLRF